MKLLLLSLCIFSVLNVHAQAYASIDGGIAFHAYTDKPAYKVIDGDLVNTGLIRGSARAMGLHVGYSQPDLFFQKDDEKAWHDALIIEYDQKFYLDHHNPAHFGFRGGYEISYHNWGLAVLPGGYYRLMNVDIARENYWIGGLGIRARWKGIVLEASKAEFYQIKLGALGLFKKD